MSKLKSLLEKALRDSINCNKCGAKLNWKKSTQIAEGKKTKKGRLTLRCHKCGNIIGYTFNDVDDFFDRL